jgi:hypothetical protein
LKSDNFVSGPGGAGWNLPKSGNAELNNVTVRGNGEFTGKITATSGTFKGTVRLNHLSVMWLWGRRLVILREIMSPEILYTPIPVTCLVKNM